VGPRAVGEERNVLLPGIRLWSYTIITELSHILQMKNEYHAWLLTTQWCIYFLILWSNFADMLQISLQIHMFHILSQFISFKYYEV
jgi:hypothetical protein